MKIISLFLLSITLFFTGCQSSRQLSLLPPTPAGVQPASIYLIRPNRMVMGAEATGLYLDGQLITQLANGNYTIFRVSPGSHMIAVKLQDLGFGSQRVVCESGKEYFFRTIAAVTPLSAADGHQLMTNLIYFPVD